MIRDGQLDREAEESTMLAYRKTGDVSVDELNGETSVDRRIGGGYGRDEGTRVVGSRAGVRRSQACVGGGRLDAEEGLLTLWDVDRDGESVENERKEDKGAHLPAGCHDGGRYPVLEEGGSGSVPLTVSKSQERPFIVLATAAAPRRFPTTLGSHFLEFAENVKAFENANNTSTDVRRSGRTSRDGGLALDAKRSRV